MAFSNAGCPGVELAPVIRAVMDTKAKGWHYKFVRHANKVDITNDMVFNGGIECKGLMRITQASPFTVDLYIKADEDASPLTIEIEAMGNVSNTVNRKIIGTISLSRE